MLFQAPRGTSDILPNQQEQWRFFKATVEEIARIFGYRRIDTPMFENAGLFVRGVGKITDIVEKETYTFEDRGGDPITLRPEGTAPVCRSYLQNGMQNLRQPVRMYYLGPFFRYDRPQAGRYRQLHQFGAEVIGDPSASVDVEVIEFASRLLSIFGVSNTSLLLNSIGDQNCRPRYIEELQAHFQQHSRDLCTDCQRRLPSNPLRLLDCKRTPCQTAILGAPESVDFLCSPCSEHWIELLDHLKVLDLPYRVESRLVRGLDYYTRTVFEIVPPTENQQNTIIAGGRYDGLIEELGGQPTPGIGFALGIERLLANMKWEKEKDLDHKEKSVLVAYVGEEPKSVAIGLCSELRRGKVSAVLGPSSKNLKGQLRYATTIEATHVVIIGENEVKNSSFILRDLSKSKQQELNLGALISALNETRL